MSPTGSERPVGAGGALSSPPEMVSTAGMSQRSDERAGGTGERVESVFCFFS